LGLGIVERGLRILVRRRRRMLTRGALGRELPSTDNAAADLPRTQR
jgi:hypothetical protein